MKEEDQKRIDLLIEATRREMQRQYLVFLRTMEVLPADVQAATIKTFTTRAAIDLEQLQKTAERLKGSE